MAKQVFDFQKMLFASLLTIGIGVVLVIVSLILGLLSFAITDSNAALVDLVTTVYLLLLFPLFFVLFFWTGMRAVKNYGFDAVGAGVVAAFSYAIIDLVKILLEMLLAVVVVSRSMGSGGGFGSTEMTVTASFFGDMMGLSGVALSAVCGLGILAIGSLINFVIGGFGALFALRKQV